MYRLRRMVCTLVCEVKKSSHTRVPRGRNSRGHGVQKLRPMQWVLTLPDLRGLGIRLAGARDCQLPHSSGSASPETRERARENRSRRLCVGSLCPQLSTFLPRRFTCGGVPSAATLVRRLLSFRCVCYLVSYQSSQKARDEEPVWACGKRKKCRVTKTVHSPCLARRK